MYNSSATEISSDFDPNLLETDAFDKNELIIWASKLELESIDYRSTSMELIEQLSKVSKKLTDSLDIVNSHIFDLKINAAEKDRKYKNFIELTVSNELDSVYEQISSLSNKIKSLQKSINLCKNQDTDLDNSKFESFISIQTEKNKLFEQKMNLLETLLKNLQNENDQIYPSIQSISNKDYNETYKQKELRSKTFSKSQNFDLRSEVRIQTKSKQQPLTNIKGIKNTRKVSKSYKTVRSNTFTRKLIFD